MTDGAQMQPTEEVFAELRAHHAKQVEADLRQALALGEADAAAGRLTSYEPGGVVARMKVALPRR